jgi:hypothetical protein
MLQPQIYSEHLRARILSLSVEEYIVTSADGKFTSGKKLHETAEYSQRVLGSRYECV